MSGAAPSAESVLATSTSPRTDSRRWVGLLAGQLSHFPHRDDTTRGVTGYAFHLRKPHGVVNGVHCRADAHDDAVSEYPLAGQDMRTGWHLRPCYRDDFWVVGHDDTYTSVRPAAQSIPNRLSVSVTVIDSCRRSAHACSGQVAENRRFPAATKRESTRNQCLINCFALVSAHFCGL